MLGDMTYEQALAKKEHLIALGRTDVYLYNRDDTGYRPWDKATDIEAGGGYRLNGPIGVRIIAEVDGLKFSWSVDFEKREANGHSYSMFDRDRLREIMRKLPTSTRRKFGRFLANEVLPCLEKTTAEWRERLNMQVDSEDCVRGLIAFAGESQLSTAA